MQFMTQVMTFLIILIPFSPRRGRGSLNLTWIFHETFHVQGAWAPTSWPWCPDFRQTNGTFVRRPSKFVQNLFRRLDDHKFWWCLRWRCCCDMLRLSSERNWVCFEIFWDTSSDSERFRLGADWNWLKRWEKGRSFGGCGSLCSWSGRLVFAVDGGQGLTVTLSAGGFGDVEFCSLQVSTVPVAPRVTEARVDEATNVVMEQRTW